MTVLPDECEDGGGGRAAWLAAGDVGDVNSSSSGLAIRRPPSDWNTLISALILDATALEGSSYGNCWMGQLIFGRASIAFEMTVQKASQGIVGALAA